MKVNFARLNHFLLPSTKDARDRLRASRVGRLFRPVGYFYETLSPEGVVFAVFAVLAGAFGLDVPSTDTHIAWGALSVLLAASIVATRLYALGGVTLQVTAPKRVGVGDPLTFTLQVTNDSNAEHQALRFAGPFLPWDGAWSAPRAALALLPAHAVARVEMTARFSERGEHHLDPFRVAALVPFGLALGPAARSTGYRFLVIPRVATIARLRTPLGRRHQPGGVALASKTGESMDLLGVRPYRPGDPARDLHARSWARIGQPVVREFQQEYFSRVGVILDIDLDGRDPAQLEAAISLTAGVIAFCSRGEALIDLLVVGGRAHALTLGRSLGSFEQALDLLACVAPGPAFDEAALLERVAPHLTRLSCVFFVALAWDAPRRAAFAQMQARGRGLGCRALVVGDTFAERDDASVVDASAIARGEALVL